mmetsp:Transcript_26468/g.37683  ORF Transcript_26468/g.37683 Transcript_26468/m.37683 type:complete len:266 (+) Transcript_26468:1180-1977(+)
MTLAFVLQNVDLVLKFTNSAFFVVYLCLQTFLFLLQAAVLILSIRAEGSHPLSSLLVDLLNLFLDVFGFLVNLLRLHKGFVQSAAFLLVPLHKPCVHFLNVVNRSVGSNLVQSQIEISKLAFQRPDLCYGCLVLAFVLLILEVVFCDLFRLLSHVFHFLCDIGNASSQLCQIITVVSNLPSWSERLCMHAGQSLPCDRTGVNNNVRCKTNRLQTGCCSLTFASSGSQSHSTWRTSSRTRCEHRVGGNGSSLHCASTASALRALHD